MISQIFNQNTNSINWDKVWEIEAFKKLKETYDSNNHETMFVSDHTVIVVNNMKNYIEQHNIPNDLAKILLLAALFHDIGKGETKMFHIENSGWVFPQHTLVGEQIARELLKDDDSKMREIICYFIRNHMALNYVINNPCGIRNLIKASCDTIYEDVCNVQNLLILRICDNDTIIDYDENDEIEFVHDLAHEMGCLTKAYSFDTSFSRFKYFNDSYSNYPEKIIKTDDTFDVVCFIGNITNFTKENYLSIEELTETESDDEILKKIQLNCESENNFTIRIDNLSNDCIEALINYFYNSNANIHFLYGSDYKKIISPTLCMDYSFN